MMLKEKKPIQDIDPRILKIANKIRELRRAAGYTSHESFAWDNGINRVQYWKIEKGCNMKLTTLFTVLDIHGISLEDFFRDL